MSKGKYKIKNINEMNCIYDVEISIPIIIGNDITKYFITSYGRVYKISKNLFINYITPSIDDGGYYKIQLNYKNIKGEKCRIAIMLERLVAMAFIPNPDNLDEVNHIDGDKSNNCVWNLEWCSHSENMIHAYINNLNHSGEDNSQSIYTEKQVRIVCEMLQNNTLTLNEISKNTGVSLYTIENIRNGKKWRKVSSEYKVDNYNVKAINTGSVPKYSDKQIIHACELLESGEYTLNQISLMTSVGLNTICDIKRHRTWRRISKNYNF